MSCVFTAIFSLIPNVLASVIPLVPRRIRDQIAVAADSVEREFMACELVGDEIWELSWNAPLAPRKTLATRKSLDQPRVFTGILFILSTILPAMRRVAKENRIRVVYETGEMAWCETSTSRSVCEMAQGGQQALHRRCLHDAGWRTASRQSRQVTAGRTNVSAARPRLRQ